MHTTVDVVKTHSQTTIRQRMQVGHWASQLAAAPSANEPLDVAITNQGPYPLAIGEDADVTSQAGERVDVGESVRFSVTTKLYGAVVLAGL